MCIAGDDVWHLDCDKVRAELGITGQSVYMDTRACLHTFVMQDGQIVCQSVKGEMGHCIKAW